MTFPWLTVLGLIPIVGALALCLPVKGAAKTIGMGFSLATLAAALGVAGLYLGGTDVTVQVPWITTFGAWWALGLDGMGLAMVLLTAILTPVVLLAEGKLATAAQAGARAYFGLVLLLPAKHNPAAMALLEFLQSATVTALIRDSGYEI